MSPRAGEAGPRVALFGLALALHAGTALVGARAAGIPLSALGAYYDGHLYLEIARSFPLPYSASGPDYLGQAPAYPALLALARFATGGALDWGLLALVTSWLCAALACVAVYGLARRLGVPAFGAALAFAALNPRWLQVAATAHPEPLAALCLLVAFSALLDARLGRSCGWLALAGLARFPALLVGIPLALATLLERRRRDLRALLLLSLPLAALGLLHGYLALRVPGFSSVAASHQVFWRTGPSWPFDALLRAALPWARSANDLWFGVTYATLAAQLAALAVGWRAGPGAPRWLALWIAAVVGFHACLSGPPAAWDYTRLTLLAWPPTLLLLWGPLARRLPRPLLVLGCAALASHGLWTAERALRDAVAWQDQLQPFLAESVHRLDADEPRWIDFGGRERTGGRP